MKFRTTISFPTYTRLHHRDSVVLLGSCFAQHMYRFLQQIKVDLTYNPYGISYNPLSIAQQIRDICIRRTPEMEMIDGSPYPFLHHGDFRRDTLVETEKKIHQSFESAIQSVPVAQHFIITFGSAFAWFRNGQVVNNCHKRPSREFERRLLSIQEMVVGLQEAFSHLPVSSTITITISPVRHLRDGMIDNGVSKAFLRAAVQLLMERDDRIQYFPSYEIMMDDLRDYRFYQDDLLHPSTMAVAYIQQHVSAELFDSSLQEREKICARLQKRLSHRPFRRGKEWKSFLVSTQRELETCMKQHPELDWSDEERRLQALLEM